MPDDFASKVIAAFQAGQQVKQSREQHEREQEEHKLVVQQHKLALDTAKLQQALHLRQIQGMTSGGSSGQATTETPTIQPPPSAPASIAQPEISPDIANNLRDLLIQRRSNPVAAAQMPIHGMSQSVETGLPPAFPDIPVQDSNVVIPGTNKELEIADAIRQARIQQGLDLEKFAGQKAVEREANTYTVDGITAPKDILDNILTQIGENKRQQSQQAFTAAENEKRLKAESTKSQLDRAAAMMRAQAAASSRISAAQVGQSRSQALSTAQKFGTEQQVKNFQIVQEAKAFTDSLPDNTDKSADDQALLYAFAKAMDPNSVVREGEYATVQKYAQSWASTYGFNAKRVFESGPFLTEDARKQMKATIGKKTQAAQKSYDTIFNEYTRNLNRITGQTNGKDLLIDYSFGGPSTASTRPQTLVGPNGSTLTLGTDGMYH